ncbi:ABC transporter permease [Parabacteroides sp. APC149_11_2_Y6]
MIKHLLKIIWHQRRSNGWIFAELLVVLATVWTMLDAYWVDFRTYHAPMGVDITNVWRFKLSSLNEHAPNYVPASEYTSSEPEDLLKLMDQIRRYPMVDGVCVTYYSCPYSGGNSWWGLRPLDGDTAVASQQSFQVRRVTPEYFDVFRIKDTDGNPITSALEDVHNPIVITQTMEDIFYHGESGKGRRVIMDNSTQEELKIAAVCPAVRATEYQRAEPCYYHVLKGATFNDFVEYFNAPSAELCVRMKKEYTKEEMNEILSDMGDLLTVNNLNVYGVQSLKERRSTMLSYQEDESRQKLSVMLFLLANVFFGVIGTFWLRTQSRRGEIGLRVALGATRVSIRRFMYLEGLCLLMLTVVPVLVYAFNMMYLDRLDSYRIPLGVGRFLITFGATYLLMAGMVCLGIWYPVKKASKMAPAESLHYE